MTKGGIPISEFETLFWVIAAGFLVGISFDFYRTVRRYLRWGPVITFIGDLGFSVGSLLILFNLFIKANALDLRFYIFWGSLLGLFLYLRLFSRLVTRAFLRLFSLISAGLRLGIKLLNIPFQVLIFLMRPPYALLRWISLLLYRMGEVTFAWQAKKVKHSVVNWLDRHFPPRTNG